MITQYDMASYEMIVEAHADDTASIQTTEQFIEPQAELRLQTVQEASQIEQQAQTPMPVDLFGISPALFVATQD